MIEVHLAYDLKPGIDEQVYLEWLKQQIIAAIKTQKIVEVRAHRNIKGNPEVLLVALLENIEDWTEFSQNEEWHLLKNPLQDTFSINLRIEVWDSSPFQSTPVRTHK
jgi:hypothetical protein